MSLFGTILDKLGLKKKPEQATTPPKTPAQTTSAKPAPQTSTTSRPAPQTEAGKPPQRQPQTPPSRTVPGETPVHERAPSTPAGAKPEQVEMVDVMSKLERMAADNPQKLNWRNSIVDLLKLLDIDSSLEARRELATELGAPPDKMQDTTSMNIWLHKEVLRKIAENGGNIPRELLD